MDIWGAKMKVDVIGGHMQQQEIDAYVAHIHSHNPGQELQKLTLELDGDFVNMTYELEPVPFERIRRITGYLVGTMDRWNDAKRAEEHDRIRHGMAV